MTLRVFMETIKDAADISGILAEIGVDLCEATGASDVAPDTFHSWLYRKDKRPQGKRYFKIEDKPPKYREVDWVGFIQFFKKIQPPVWTDLRNAFNNDEINDDGIIVCNTNDENEFYWSLLEQFCKLLRISTPAKPASLRHILPGKQVIFGRESEIKQIGENFESSSFVALTGIGGIGKSYTALAYAYELIKNEGYVVQYVNCEDSDTLHDAVLRLEFDGLKEGKKGTEFDLRIDALKKCQQPTLIIFDNLNRSIRDDLRKLTVLGQYIKFLITSRESTVLGDNKQCTVRIKSLSFDELLKLYCYHRFSDGDDHSKFINDRKELLTQMFEKIYSHTLTVVFLAKIPRFSSLNEHEICDKLNEGLDISSGFAHIKSGDSNFKIDMRELIKKIIDIFLFNDAQKCIMKHMALMPLSGIKLRMFRELTRLKEIEVLKLIDGNWIMMEQEEQRISLHPLVAEAIFDMHETCPTVENCKEFLERLWSKEASNIGGRIWYDLNKTKCHVIRKLGLSLPSLPASLVVKILFETQAEDVAEEPNSIALVKENYESDRSQADHYHDIIKVFYGSEAVEAVIADGIKALDKYIDLENTKSFQDYDIDELLEEYEEYIDTDASGAKTINLSKLLMAFIDSTSDEYEVVKDPNTSCNLEDSNELIDLTNICLEESSDLIDFQSAFESQRFIDSLRTYVDKVIRDFKKRLESEDDSDDEDMSWVKEMARDLNE